MTRTSMTATTLTSLGLGWALLMSSVTSAVAQPLDVAPADGAAAPKR